MPGVRNLDRPFHFARPEAPAANVQAHRPALHQHPHPLHVGRPGAAGSPVGVTDAVSPKITFVTHLAVVGHGDLLPSSATSPVYHGGARLARDARAREEAMGLPGGVSYGLEIIRSRADALSPPAQARWSGLGACAGQIARAGPGHAGVPTGRHKAAGGNQCVIANRLTLICGGPGGGCPGER